jgi:hypothetical protein
MYAVRNDSENNTYYTDYSYSSLVAFSDKLFKPRRVQGGKFKHKFGLINGAMSTAIWEAAMAKQCFCVNTDMSETYGIAGIKRYQFPKGLIDVFEHPDISDMFSSDNPYLLALDLHNVGIKDFEPTVLQQGLAANDLDGLKEQYLTENALYVALRNSHGEFGASADC